ncbi:MAG: DUF4446 family protein [Ardenticatenales bacterium]|nr:DUF4446 family protein [Ardenticatenales bacterium]
MQVQELYNFYQIYAAELTLGSAAAATLLLLWVIVLQWRLSSLHRRYRAAMKGAEGADLEGWLAQQRTTQEEHGERLRALESYSHTLGKTLASRAGRVGIVRFNPFQDSGGDQSFAIAWIDDEANGVVLSSLHHREGNRVYAKPLTCGSSTYTLSEEEQKAVKQAVER